MRSNSSIRSTLCAFANAYLARGGHQSRDECRSVRQARRRSSPFVKAFRRPSAVPPLVFRDSVSERLALPSFQLPPLLLGPRHHSRDRVRFTFLQHDATVAPSRRNLLEPGPERSLLPPEYL